MSGAIPFDAEEPLPLTGERTAPGIPQENYWFQRHVAAYRFAAERVSGARVLDAGCGEGYGAAILAEAAAEVVGLDIEPEVVRRAEARYPGVSFVAGDAVTLEHPDASFDAIVCLQVVEHLHTPQGFLARCARVLKPGGTLIVSTPNRLTFSPAGVRNPFHHFEFAPAELAAALEREFDQHELLGTFHGPSIRALETLLRRPFPERLLAQPTYEWPDWLTSRVARVRAEDFRIRARKLAASLDLIAIARA